MRAFFSLQNAGKWKTGATGLASAALVAVGQMDGLFVAHQRA